MKLVSKLWVFLIWLKNKYVSTHNNELLFYWKLCNSRFNCGSSKISSQGIEFFERMSPNFVLLRFRPRWCVLTLFPSRLNPIRSESTMLKPIRTSFIIFIFSYKPVLILWLDVPGTQFLNNTFICSYMSMNYTMSVICQSNVYFRDIPTPDYWEYLPKTPVLGK